MKIIFTISDAPNKYREFQATGNLPQLKIRTVEIELHPKQLEKLNIDKKMESIESVKMLLENRSKQ